MNKIIYGDIEWYQQHLAYCKDIGISKAMIQLFIQLQEQKYEQSDKETSNSRI